MQATVALATAAAVTYALVRRRRQQSDARTPGAGKDNGTRTRLRGGYPVIQHTVTRIFDDHPSRSTPQPSPLKLRSWPPQKSFVGERQTVLLPPVTYSQHKDQLDKALPRMEFDCAGPRDVVYWKPTEVRAAIVTCGGLCPGLNTVIREIVMCLHYSYQVKAIFGVPGGYRGFYSSEYIPLTPDTVSEVHLEGGTFLGSSRGGFDLEKILDALRLHKVNHVYIIGGDGTHRGALALSKGAKAAGIQCAFACVPKTIDNDVPLIDKSFGFDTAVEQAVRVINSAHIEACAHPRGLGIVKLMGRHAGFIAMAASLAARQANAVVIPEMEFRCDQLCKYISQRLDTRGNFVLVVAEGTQVCTEDRCLVRGGEAKVAVDESGNKKSEDVGLLLDEYITKWFAVRKKSINVKYLDPTYIIRSVPANPSDSILCSELAYNAVHGIFAGCTCFTVGKINNVQVMLPIELVATSPSRRVDARSRQFVSLMLNTGQPKLS